jgi:hypothetical protein
VHLSGKATPFDHVRRTIVFVVNSLSEPKTDRDKSASEKTTNPLAPAQDSSASVPRVQGDRSSGRRVLMLITNPGGSQTEQHHEDLSVRSSEDQP